MLKRFAGQWPSDLCGISFVIADCLKSESIVLKTESICVLVSHVAKCILINLADPLMSSE